MQADVRLRLSRATDLGFVISLEFHPANRGLIGQWTDQEHLDAIAHKGAREHWIIEREGRPAGYLIAYDTRAQGMGIYVKRILVADKQRGTGGAALRRFVEMAFARERTAFVWLMVFEHNARARAVYDSLGFAYIEPSAEEAKRYNGVDAMDETCRPRILRMRLDEAEWWRRSGGVGR